AVHHLHPRSFPTRRSSDLMHTWLAQRTQLYQDADYPIFLAEVASTFNEELLTHYLLERTNDNKMRAYIINRQIDDIRGTLFRQRSEEHTSELQSRFDLVCR